MGQEWESRGDRSAGHLGVSPHLSLRHGQRLGGPSGRGDVGAGWLQAPLHADGLPAAAPLQIQREASNMHGPPGHLQGRPAGGRG